MQRLDVHSSQSFSAMPEMKRLLGNDLYDVIAFEHLMTTSSPCPLTCYSFLSTSALLLRLKKLTGNVTGSFPTSCTSSSSRGGTSGSEEQL